MGSSKVFAWLSLMLAVDLLLFMISSEVSAARDLAEATKTKSTSTSKQFIKNNKESSKPATGVDDTKSCGGNGEYGGGNGGYGGGNGGYGGGNGGNGEYGGGNGGYGGGNGGYGGDNGGYGGGYGGNGGDGGGGYGGYGGYGGNGGNGGGGYGGYGGKNGGYGGGGYGVKETDSAYDPVKTSSDGGNKSSSISVKSIPAPLGGTVASGYQGASSKSSTSEYDKLQTKAVETKANKP